MQANGYQLAANETPNHSLTRSDEGRGSGEKAKPSNRVRLTGNIARRKPGKRIREHFERFWADYARHWKPSTRKRNESASFKEILSAFGDRRIDDLAKGDILFWRDSFVERPGVFNRTLPVFSVMIGYRRIGAALREAEADRPAQVAIVRLLLFTGVRVRSPVTLRLTRKHCR